MKDVYLVVSVTYDYDEAKTVIAVRSSLDKAIELAKETPHYSSGTWLAQYYIEVLVAQLDGAVNTDGLEVVWTDRE